MRILKGFLLTAAILILAVAALAVYVVRGGFRRFEITPYPLPPAAFTDWNDVLAQTRDISLTTIQIGVVHMDACLNLDPASPSQAKCDPAPRDLAVLVHWVHHARFGDFLIDTGFDGSFAKHPRYGSYTQAMKFFNWTNGVTNRQEPGTDLAVQLTRLNLHPKAVFFTHLHADHTGGGSALGPQTEFVSAKPKLAFWREPPSRTTFQPTRRFFGIDFLAAPSLLPLGPWVDLLGDGSFWAMSAPGHTDDDMAFLVNSASPTLLTGDASHFAWAFNTGVGPRGWNDAGIARGGVSLERTACLRESLSERKTHLRTRSGTFLI